MILGESTGRCAVLEMGEVEFGFGALEIPEAEEATFTLPFTALAHLDGTGATEENEIKLTFF